MNTTLKINWTTLLVTIAANMRKAFTVCFPSEQEDGDHHDDPELWCDLTLEDQQTVAVFCAHSSAGGGR